MSYVPSRGLESDPVFIDLPPSDPLYQRLQQKVDRCGGTSYTIRRIQKISNPALDHLYAAQRSMIGRETGEAGLARGGGVTFMRHCMFHS